MGQFVAVYAALDTGLDRINDALKSEDCLRGEIEADHIHNLPNLIDTTSAKSFDYYLEKERDFFLWKLGENYGNEISETAMKQFQKYWDVMAE